VIGQTFSHYRVVEKLGAGGMGEVYLARDEHLGRDVAVKVLPAHTFGDDSARRRFRREAQALSRLNHPHIATVYDFDTAGDVDFLVMEYVQGAPLSEHLRGGPLAQRDIVALGGDIASALEEAHERGVVHRDLKPGNIIVTPRSRAKVLDFGLARLSDAAAEQLVTASDSSLHLAGTVPYMAPEQLRGEPIDARTDIYALGVVLYEMATGRLPFEEAHTGRLADAILHAPLPPPSRLQPRLSPELERIILKCLDRSPDNRYQSAREIGVDLRRLATSATATAIEAAPAGPARPSTKRWAIAAGAAALTAAGAIALWQVNRPPAPGTSSADAVRSVVALPSKVLAGASDQFLTDAIPNTISAHLTQVQGLETRLPPSSVEVARVGGDLATLAGVYDVSAFVLSSVTADANRLVLNVQLVDTSSKRLLWSRDFEGERGNYLALAREAAETLRVAVRPGAAGVATRKGTTSSAAELAYQEGLHHFNRFNYQHRTEDFDRALAAYQRALERDPQMAQAAAEIGWLYVFKLEAGAPLDEVLPETQRWSRRALEIDGTNSRAWALVAFSEMFGPNPNTDGGLVAGLRATAHGPRDPFALNALGLSVNMVSTELALAAMEESSRADPLYLYPTLNAAEALTYLGRLEEALERSDAVLRLEPEISPGLARKALVLIEMGRVDEAAALAARLRQHVKEGRMEPQLVSTIEDAVALHRGDAAAKAAALERLVRANLGASYVSEYPPVYLWLIAHGRTDDVLATMEARARAGRVPYDFLRMRTEFAPLARDPRFERILALSRGHFDRMLRTLDRARERGEFPPFLEQPVAALRKRYAPAAGPATN
jgi:tetratricopeptide (TPR) repeat protein/predicted Ser/Thr protein kinase